jgi:flagellar basal body P-ring protein FlgI
MRFVLVILLIATVSANAELLQNLVEIDDGLNFDSIENISDDYIRLALITPDYKTVAETKKSIDDWLGNGMVTIKSNQEILVQAPRDANARIEFIAALLQLNIAVPNVE